MTQLETVVKDALSELWESNLTDHTKGKVQARISRKYNLIIQHGYGRKHMLLHDLALEIRSMRGRIALALDYEVDPTLGDWEPIDSVYYEPQ